MFLIPFYFFVLQVSARKLKPTPPRPRSLHERILEEIKSERKLRPVSPDEIRRSRLGKRAVGNIGDLAIGITCCLKALVRSELGKLVNITMEMMYAAARNIQAVFSLPCQQNKMIALVTWRRHKCLNILEMSYRRGNAQYTQ